MALVGRALFLEFGQKLREFGGGKLLANLRHFSAGKFIAAFVERMAGVAFEPVPGDVMLSGHEIELSPEVVVLDGLLVHRAPAACFPAPDPALDAVPQVFGVRVAMDFATLLEAAQRGDGGLEFHAVIGGGRFAAADFLGARAVLEELLTAATARVPAKANIDFAMAAFIYAAGLPDDTGEWIMAIARTAGWLAHAMEEYHETPLRFRPRAEYIGP